MLGTATRPNGRRRSSRPARSPASSPSAGPRDWISLVAVVLAPLGFIVFQLYVDHTAGERGAWFRVQTRGVEGGDELRRHRGHEHRSSSSSIRCSSPTDALTALSMAALVAMVWCAWKVRLHPVLAVVQRGRRRPDADPRDRHGPPAIPDHRVPAASSPPPPGGRDTTTRRRAPADRTGMTTGSAGPHRVGHGARARWRGHRRAHRACTPCSGRFRESGDAHARRRADPQRSRQHRGV